ncbi:DUF637 domain-containing protein, partial [Paraburkholderia kururiensis]|uniref:DUF637 domain-containing protein n=1 Tax=Paraburkholderia kururiensis TaxID=984307 RepID=UPI0018F56B3B
VPEVLLPQNYATVSADGEITGTNVTLDYANSILNTGTVTARDLTVNTGTLTNEQRSTNIGVIYGEAGGESIKTTGTVVQQGGFMSAMNYDLNAQSINQIGGALQKISADGSVDTASTQAMLDSLKSQLGGSFTQSTVSNDLHTEVIGGMQWYDQLWMTVVIIGISIMSAGAASAAVGTMASATAGSGSMFAAAGTSASGAAVGAGVGNIAVSAAISGMVNSALTQSAFGNGSFSVGQMFEAGATSFVTAGLMNGITVNGGSLGWTFEASNNSLAALAGVQSVGNAMVPQAGAASGSLPTQLAALAGEAMIQAGVQTGIQGGSFLTNLRNSAVNDLAAAGAYAIGNGTDPLTLQNIMAHAALGCAASAAEGTGCAGGALGAATSSLVTPFALAGIDPNGAAPDIGMTAMIAAFAALAGGGVAGALGQNVSAGETWAQNEALNNDLGSLLHAKQAADAAKGAFASAVSSIGNVWNSIRNPQTSSGTGFTSAINAGANVPAMESAANLDLLKGLGNVGLNLASVSLPGAPGYAQYFQYSNPIVGALGELYGVAGLSSLVSSAVSSVATTAERQLTFGDNGRKLDFLFNNNIDSSNAYNASRAAGNASRIGIADTPANRAEVTRLFNQAYNDPSSIVGPGTVPGSNLREFFLPGVTGTGSKIQFVELNGRVLTIIAK